MPHQPDRNQHPLPLLRLALPRLPHLQLHLIAADARRRENQQHFLMHSNSRINLLPKKLPALDIVRLSRRPVLIRFRAHHKWPTTHPRCRLLCWASPTYPRTELSSPENLLRNALLHRVEMGRGPSAFPPARPVPVQGGVRFPDYFTPRFAYAEISSFGLVYYDVGTSVPEAPDTEQINCETVLLVLVATLRYSLRLYEALGYFGLVECGLSLSPATNLYPYMSDSFADRFAENRSIEREIALRIAWSVKELGETWLEKSKEAYKEFLWAFGLNMRREEIDADFVHWGIDSN